VPPYLQSDHPFISTTTKHKITKFIKDNW